MNMPAVHKENSMDQYKAVERSRELLDSLLGGKCRHTSHVQAYAWSIRAVADQTSIEEHTVQR